MWYSLLARANSPAHVHINSLNISNDDCSRSIQYAMVDEMVFSHRVWWAQLVNIDFITRKYSASEILFDIPVITQCRQLINESKQDIQHVTKRRSKVTIIEKKGGGGGRRRISAGDKEKETMADNIP